MIVTAIAVPNFDIESDIVIKALAECFDKPM